MLFNYWFYMETNRLKQFCVVYETYNLRKAADLLFMSHSALSKSMKVLQEETGLKLLEQIGRGIVVTDEGKAFVQKARSMLDLEKMILTKSMDIPKQFRVATFESFSTHLLGMRWHKYFGEQALHIHEMPSGHLEKAVADGLVDAAITYDPVPTRDLEFIFLGKVTMGIYCRKGYFKKSGFSNLPFVAPLIPAQGTPTASKGLDGWPEHEIPRNVKFRVDLMESGLALVRAGQAAIFIPDFVARSQNEALAEEFRLVEREYPGGLRKIERKVFLIVRPERQKESKIKLLKDMIKKECL